MRGSEYLFWFVIFFWMVLYLLPERAFAWPLSLREWGGETVSRYLS